MANGIKIKVNGLTHGVQASLDTPLLYVLHNELHLHGPRFGCGLAQCGACSVLLERQGDPVVCDAGCRGGRAEHHDARGPAGSVGGAERRYVCCGAGAASVAAGVDRCAGAALRLLPERDDDPGRRPPGDDQEPVRGPDPHGDERASLPLRDLSENPDRDPAGRGRDGKGRCVMTGLLHEKEFSRRSFIKAGGVLIVGFSLAGSGLAGKAVCGTDRGGLPAQPEPDRLVAHDRRRQHRDAEHESDRDRQRHHDRLPDDRGRRARHGDEPDALRPRRHLHRPLDRQRRWFERDCRNGSADPRRRGQRPPGPARARLDPARRPGEQPDGVEG